MASPQQRPDPERRPADYQQLEDRGRRRRASRGWLAWWWVWLVIIIGAIWFAGWGWGGYGGWWWGSGGYTRGGRGAGGLGAPGTNAATLKNGGPGPSGGAAIGGQNATGAFGTARTIVSGPGVGVLTATNKKPFIGDPFSVNNAVVRSRVNDHALWIAANSTVAPMLVELSGAGNTTANAHIAGRDYVNVTGTVRKAPPQAQARHSWKLGSRAAKRLAREGAYIQGTQITLIGKSAAGNNGGNGVNGNG